MSTPSSALDRLEARLEVQAARIDELSRALERHGVQIEQAPFARERRRPRRRSSDRRRAGSAARV